jgi:hypothetical protein
MKNVRNLLVLSVFCFVSGICFIGCEWEFKTPKGEPVIQSAMCLGDDLAIVYFEGDLSFFTSVDTYVVTGARQKKYTIVFLEHETSSLLGGATSRVRVLPKFTEGDTITIRGKGKIHGFATFIATL